MAIIHTAVICDLHTKQMKSLEIHQGLDMQLVLTFQKEWSDVLNVWVQDIIDQGKSLAETIKLIEENHLSDAQWNWSNKMLACNSKEYEWFYLKIEDKVEAVCIIFHPKNSRIDTEEIFYVDFLAVAPWNRNTSYGSRQYSSLGTTLLSICSKQAKVDLSYRYGFSLHSLPQALSYYIKIGMIDYGIDTGKENLNYLEMDEENSKKLVGAHVL